MSVMLDEQVFYQHSPTKCAQHISPEGFVDILFGCA